MIKSFRGLIADEGQDRIRLSSKDGLMGYRIKKFQIFPQHPGTVSNKENVCQIWAEKQDTPTAETNFDTPLLLGVAYFTENTDSNVVVSEAVVVFDSIKFNQDIYVTHVDAHSGNTSVNYYIELEQVKLDLNEATVATLKDMRGRE
jgi:hypothetical protein